MLKLFSMLFNFLGGGALKTVTDAIVEARKQEFDAENESDRILARIKADLLEAQQAVLIAEQGSNVTRWIRPAFATPFILYNFKIIVWDKMLGLGTTDPLSTHLIELEMIVFGAYFLTRPVEKLFRRK